MRGLEEFLVLWRVLDVIEEHRCLLSATARRELGEVGAVALWKLRQLHVLNDALAAVRRHFQDLDLRLRHALVGGLAAVDPELAVTLAFGRGIDGSKSVGAASSGRPTVCSVAACVAVLRRRKPGVTRRCGGVILSLSLPHFCVAFLFFSISPETMQSRSLYGTMYSTPDACFVL